MILSKTEIDKLEDFIDGMPLIDYVVREIIDDCAGTDDEPVIVLSVILKDDHNIKYTCPIYPYLPQFSNMELGRLYTLKELIGKERVGL